jgi:hypothetical protein
MISIVLNQYSCILSRKEKKCPYRDWSRQRNWPEAEIRHNPSIGNWPELLQIETEAGDCRSWHISVYNSVQT